MTVERWTLPGSWGWVAASDVAVIVGGGTPSTKDAANFAEAGSGTSWLGPADLTGYSEPYISRGRRDLTAKGLAACGATIMPKGTVLFSSRAPIGYCAIAANEVSTNQGFKSWVCSVGVLPEYVRHYLLSAVEYADSLASGTTFREISGKRVGGMAFPLPPTAEQRRIVAKLDALTARLARARAELDRVHELAAKLRDEARSAAYTGELTRDVRDGADADWHVQPLRSLSQVVTGATPPTSGKDLFFGGDLPFFKPTDLDAGYHVNAPRETLTEAGAARARVAPAGSTLVTCIGATIGKTGFARVRCAFNQQINAAVPIEGRAEPRWLYWTITSPAFREAIIENSSATTMPIINKGRFQQLELPTPPMTEQAAIADRLEAIFARADRIEAEAARARALVDRLESAILARAFRGQLVPQDPADEPAAALLDRIRAERAGVVKAKRGRKAAAGG